MKPVKLFYLRSCPFCKKALRYIDEAVSYTHLTLPTILRV